MASPDYIPGPFESSKFAHRKLNYAESLERIKSLGYSVEDYIHHFPCFTGAMTLARYLSLYECYQKTLGVAGNIAEIGMYKGAGSLFLAKLTQLYEPLALTQVHGFDWFQGAQNLSESDQKHLITGSYAEPQERVNSLVESQDLSHLVKIHCLDMASTQIEDFFHTHRHLQFKLVIFDIGIYEVVSKSLPLFWNRLTPGGIMIFDQYNFDIAPGETEAVRELLPNAKIRTFPNGWMPTAYVVKE
ncbi:MAG: class I SAM-dependent methyltransferase [Burkholderiales bacterium]